MEPATATESGSSYTSVSKNGLFMFVVLVGHSCKVLVVVVAVDHTDGSI